MHIATTESQQHEMCLAHYDGAAGILVSGLVWLAAALVSVQLGVNNAVWTLLIGGAFIYPLGLLVTKALGRSAKTDKANALNQLAMASTVWLILCCVMAYGLFLLKPQLFFPAMMAVIGCRYLIFASIFGKSIFWMLGASLIIAANLTFFLAVSPSIAAGLGGLIEIVFAIVVFSRATAK
jgi:hypothetical protein